MDEKWEKMLDELLISLFLATVIIFLINTILRQVLNLLEPNDENRPPGHEEFTQALRGVKKELKSNWISDCAQYTLSLIKNQLRWSEEFKNKKADEFREIGEFAMTNCGEWPEWCREDYDGPLKVPVVNQAFAEHFLGDGLLGTGEFEWMDANETSPQSSQRGLKEIVSLPPFREESGEMEVFTAGAGAFGKVAEMKENHAKRPSLFSTLWGFISSKFSKNHNPDVVKQIKVHNMAEMNAVFREISFLSQLKHPHIAKYLESWVVRAEKPELPVFEEPTLLFAMTAVPSNENTQRVDVPSTSDSTSVNERLFDFALFDYSVHIRMEYYTMTLDTLIAIQLGGTRMFANNLNSRELMATNYYSIWCRVASELFSAIFHIHQHHVIHRDIKPENILVKTIKVECPISVVLGDFGISRMNVTDEQNSTELLTMQMGTKSYAAPEQWTSAKYDKSADVFSAGLVVYEMVSQFDSIDVKYENFDYIRANGDFPMEFQEMHPKIYSCIARTVRLRPRERPTAAEVYMKMATLYTNENHDWYSRLATDEGFRMRTTLALTSHSTQNCELLNG